MGDLAQYSNAYPGLSVAGVFHKLFPFSRVQLRVGWTTYIYGLVFMSYIELARCAGREHSVFNEYI